MINKKTSEHNTQGKILEHRKEYIDSSLKKFIKEYDIKKWPVDCVSLINAIIKKGRIKLWFKPSSALKEDEYAKTIYIPGLDKYLMVINEEKLRHPFESITYQRLNLTLARQIAHIFLNHSDLPDECKDEFQRESEALEAEAFADRLLTPGGKAAIPESRDDKPYFILPNNVNDIKPRLSEALYGKHYDDTLVIRLKDVYIKALFFLYCLTVLGSCING